MADRPFGRKKKTTGESTGGAEIRDDQGLGTGPVGNRKKKPQQSTENKDDKGILSDLLGGGSSSSDSSSSGGSLFGGGSSGGSLFGGGSGAGKKSGASILIIIILAVVLWKSGLLNNLLGGGSGGGISELFGTGSGGSGGGYSQSFTELLSGGGSSSSSSSGGWSIANNNGKLDRSVDENARAKYTKIKGNNKDTVTVMIYMCGTDLESKNAMGSRDLQEMLNASNTGNINLLIYTGGCKKWQNNVVSSKTNQIYRISNGNITCIESNMGNKVMTDPATLTEFIKYCAKNYPANRNILILWDHGSGSQKGYGYDEKNVNYGSMDLSGVNRALKNAGIKFDFIGFDACLMATAETALVSAQYADYMIASEESEPGIGWYYTDWLTQICKNTSTPTLDIGKTIVDTFTTECAKSCPGQTTTLSVIDLAEFQATVPGAMSDFAKDTSSMISGSDYKTVSNARSSAREFSSYANINQVDMVDLAVKMGSSEGEKLAEALVGAVKYNRTSNITNAYGVSVYFPGRYANTVDSMVNVYGDIGMDKYYTRCIQEFASMGVAGQVAGGGSHSSIGSLLGSLMGSGSSSSSSSSSGMDIGSLLSAFMGSGRTAINGLSTENTHFLDETLDIDKASAFITDNFFDASALKWHKNDQGNYVITLTDEDQWDLVEGLDLNLFVDNGKGYIDLGYDNVFEFTEDGDLLAPTDRTWVAVNGQTVAYYRLSTSGDENDYVITGYIPAYLNGDRVILFVVFDDENPDGYIAGATYDYSETDADVIAKNLTEINDGDEIDFICDFYDYDGNYQESYYLGKTLTVKGGMSGLKISNEDIGKDKAYAMYTFTDIYGEQYWSDAIEE
ncbi:MAG: peptidase C11 [Lachnospiraceae bacterium]|nr:peptidase C11 [Lachnospiraceae bacterium]